MHPWIATARFFCIAWALALAPSWAAELRVALVIGNAAYESAPLQNPVKDADGVARALTAMGFQVVALNNATKAQIEQGIADVRGALQGKQGVGLLYYAGHGMQLDWRNYLMPVDARPASAADVRTQAVDVQQVLDAFRAAGNRLNIVVLDACRDSPFASTASGKGLAQMDAPPGTLLAYATAPGNVAEDGDGNGGLYTQHLLREMQQREARVEDVFKRVRFNVRRQSAGRQIPWEATSLEDDFFFDSGVKATTKPAERKQAYEAEQADWLRIAGSSQVNDFYEHLKKYPSGSYSELAQTKLQQLQQPRIEMQPDRDGHTESELRWMMKDGDRYDFVLKDGYTGLERKRGFYLVRAVSPDVFEDVGTNVPTDRVSRDGFYLSDNYGTYDPPWPFVPGGILQVGRKWSGRTTLTHPDGTKLWIDVDTRIAARERITVPLGTFDAFRIDIRMQRQSGSHLLITAWYTPGWGAALKLRFEDRASRPADVTIREMVARSRKE